ncbi:rpsA [Symbiodinium natans]|uniref:RpsA protein n=1 Tax=Symbiodinium natans TaxID=878477 RepID=A0A812SIJ6_9DINO|nr:rpsA [Symbiodinium natans]
MVDVGAQKEGLIPISKMLGAAPNGSCFDCVHEGEEVEVWVSEVSHPEDLRHGKLVLAMDKDKISRPDTPGPMANVMQFQSRLGKVWFNGTVSRHRSYGMFVRIEAPAGDGFVEGLVPRSECTYNATVGSEVSVRALRLNPDKNHLYLSMRAAAAKGMEARLSVFKNMTGQRLPGTVTRSGKFGAFVEVSHPDGGNIVGLVPSLAKEDAGRQWPHRLEDLHIGQELTGVVLRVRPLALVDVGLKVRGVLPVGKMSSSKQETATDEAHVNLGDRVQVWVSEIRYNSSKRERPTLILAMDENRIYSLWNSGPMADLKDFVGLDTQQWYTGTLTRKMEAGWFVSVPSPHGEGSRQGFVYLPECKGDAEIGSQVQVRVLGVDLEKGYLDLSMRTSSPLKGAEAKLALYRDLRDHWLPGRVKSFGAYGASVEVWHPVAGTLVGILPKAHMERAQDLAVDKKIKVRVWDVTDERLFLSMQEKVKEIPKEFLALVEDELGSAMTVELLEEGQKVEVRVTQASKEGLELALCT